MELSSLIFLYVDGFFVIQARAIFVLHQGRLYLTSFLNGNLRISYRFVISSNYSIQKTFGPENLARRINLVSVVAVTNLVQHKIHTIKILGIVQTENFESALGWLVWHELSHVRPAFVSGDTLIPGDFSTRIVMLRQGRCDQTQEPLDLLQRLVPRLSSWDMFLN